MQKHTLSSHTYHGINTFISNRHWLLQITMVKISNKQARKIDH